MHLCSPRNEYWFTNTAKAHPTFYSLQNKIAKIILLKELNYQTLVIHLKTKTEHQLLLYILETNKTEINFFQQPNRRQQTNNI